MVRHSQVAQVMRRCKLVLLTVSALVLLPGMTPVSLDLTVAHPQRWMSMAALTPSGFDVLALAPAIDDTVDAQITQMQGQERLIADGAAALWIATQDEVGRSASLDANRGPARAHNTWRDASVVATQAAQDADISLSYANSKSAVEDIADLQVKGFRIDKMDHLPPATGDSEWACLTEALYFEARGEDLQGQIAVAEVILNRVASRRFPDTVCKVISQGASRRNACQFSFKCDGVPERFAELRAYERVGKVAQMVLDGQVEDLTKGATHYHTTRVKPGWARRLMKTTQIGEHLFYRRPDQSASN